MIVFTSEDRAESTMMNLYGDLAPEDSVTMLEDHLDRLASVSHLVVDITQLGVVGSPARDQLITHLRSAPAHALTELIGHESGPDPRPSAQPDAG